MRAGAPIVWVINKVDTCTARDLAQQVEALGGVVKDASLFYISALRKQGLDALFDRVLALLPEHPAYFPMDDLSDKNERFVAAECIREQIFKQYDQEVPYGTQVDVVRFKSKGGAVHMSAILYVERASQKGIILGARGKAIKALGISSRKRLEVLLGCKVHLGLSVKVSLEWRSDKKALRNFGLWT